MRLTADLILRSRSYLNPLKEREVDLRGNKIAVIENLGATQDQYDCLDLSDNEINKLDNFPQLNRVKCLLLSNNRISRIGSNLQESIPNLETLILTNNKINTLSDIDPLETVRSLRYLSLLDNLITKTQHYRLYIIHKLPFLRVLDFRKIKQKERKASESLFGNHEQKAKQPSIKTTEVQSSITAQPQSMSATGLSTQEVQAIKIAIKNTTSIEEMVELENALVSGKMIKASDQIHTD